MPKFLVRIDAVNLLNVFGDCNDLSTVRGGGLAVLNIAEKVYIGLPTKFDAKLITKGASQGLLSVSAGSESEIRQAIAEATGADPLLRYVTVLSAAEPHEKEETEVGFQDPLGRLTNKIRWEQMQSPTVVYPELVDNGGVCKTDKVRPAPQDGVSPYTRERQNYGRSQRTGLLKALLPEAEFQSLQATTDFGDLVEATKNYGNLRGKMAVLRFDGNGFGAMFRQCETQRAYQELSNRVQQEQEGFFRRLLLDGATQRSGWWSENGSKAYIEILVFGGDEVLFVVPAHLGWSALRTFYEHVTASGSDYSYAGGIVFCHHKAPIHAIRELASELVDEAKPGNYAHYQVLESFDQLGEPAEEYLAKRYRFAGGTNCGRVSLQAIRALEDGMETIRKAVAKTKLHALTRRLIGRSAPARFNDSERRDEIAKLMEYRSGPSLKAEQAIEAFYQAAGSDAAFVHLTELWEYVRPANWKVME